MSSPSHAAVSIFSAIDWNTVAIGAALFCATVITTVMGAREGKKKISKHLESAEAAGVTGVVVQDNQTLREMTLVSKDLRDQLLLHNLSLQALHKVNKDEVECLEELTQELKKLRKSLEVFDKAGKP